MKDKSCCFIGHRTIEISEELRKNIYAYVEYLIVNEGVKRFLFGSRSEFGNLCNVIVAELKVKYPEIKRIAYPCRHESPILECDRAKTESAVSSVLNRKTEFVCVDEVYEYKKVESFKGAYVARNAVMIDDSDFCVFYCVSDYKPPRRKYSKRDYTDYQPNSGTRIAYCYANRMGKIIKNFGI